MGDILNAEKEEDEERKELTTKEVEEKETDLNGGENDKDEMIELEAILRACDEVQEKVQGSVKPEEGGETLYYMFVVILIIIKYKVNRLILVIVINFIVIGNQLQCKVQRLCDCYCAIDCLVTMDFIVYIISVVTSCTLYSMYDKPQVSVNLSISDFKIFYLNSYYTILMR